jgi:hypothetical protein
VQKFSPYNFFGWTFAAQRQILRFMIPASNFGRKFICFAYISTFTNFKAKHGMKRLEKNEKDIL